MWCSGILCSGRAAGRHVIMHEARAKAAALYTENRSASIMIVSETLAQ